MRDKPQVLQARDERAGVVKLVDALDSKSSEPQARVGSIPTSGTKHFKHLESLPWHSFLDKTSILCLK
jgi:hypothetical protein